MIAESLKQFGAARSGVIDEKGVILAGNGTYEQLEAAGIKKVKIIKSAGDEWVVIQRAGLTDEQKRALAIADNRTGELAEWDGPSLLSQGIDLKPWFSIDELRDFKSPINCKEGPEPQLDKAEELRKQYGVKSGQIWQLGDHQLMCGDSVNDLELLMRNLKGNMLITSPPYNQNIDQFKPSGMHKEGNWVSKVERMAYADSLPEPIYQERQKEALLKWHTCLGDGASVFYNHKNRYREKRVVSPLEWLPGPFSLRQEIIWSRPGSVTQNARMFLPSDERIYWMYKGNDFYFNDLIEIKSWSTVWRIGLEANKTHAVPFPIELPARCIQACSILSNTIIDPFAGSGTTLIACEQLGRRCYAMEISPEYVAVSIQRWVDLTGKEPKLLNEKPVINSRKGKNGKNRQTEKTDASKDHRGQPRAATA